MDDSRAKLARTINQPIYKQFRASLYLLKLWPVIGPTCLINGPNRNWAKQFQTHFETGPDCYFNVPMSHFHEWENNAIDG